MKEKLHSNFGIMIDNIDVDLRSLLLEYKVVIVRGVKLTEQEYINFCHIGHIWTTDDEMKMEQKYQIGQYKELVAISNHHGALGSMELLWHADGSHHPTKPYPIRCLYGAKIPSNTSATTFADMGLGLSRLSVEWKQKIETLKAIHRPTYNVGWNDIKVVRPFIRNHPVTNEQSLSLDNHFTVEIDGMDPIMGKIIIDDLVKMATSCDNTITHQWEPNDIVIFDNNNTVHRRERITHDEERLLWRITMDY
ncbi:MAG: TauD/TfdA family dioxygenase [Candidimonas sp.]